MSATRLPRDVMLAQRLPRVAARVDVCPSVQQVLHLDRLIPASSQIEACRESTERLLAELTTSDGESFADNVAMSACEKIGMGTQTTEEIATRTKVDLSVEKIMEVARAGAQKLQQKIADLQHEILALRGEEKIADLQDVIVALKGEAEKPCGVDEVAEAA